MGETMTHEYVMPEGQTLVVTVTEEGVIFDAFQDGEPVGTIGRYASEWYEEVMR